jgi:GTP-binding protein YchF
MKLGIIGLPMCGKSTLFEALTKTRNNAESKMENRQATVVVPDSRIDILNQIYNPKKTTFAQIDYFLPGMAPSKDGPSKESSVWMKVRDCDAMIHVVRHFEGHGYGLPAPLDDFKRMDEELVFSDLVITEKRIERLDADLKKHRKIHSAEYELLQNCKSVLEMGIPLRRYPHLAKAPLLRGFTFLSAKPMLVVLNSADQGNGLPDGFESHSLERHLSIKGMIEREIARMSENEAADYLAEFGIADSAMILVIRESYALLGLISFFTVGLDEVRAWTVLQGSSAVDAAEAIHSDIQKGFIRAEVVAYDDLIEAGSTTEARKRGRVRLEGKEYTVQDGDVMEFRFSV